VATTVDGIKTGLSEKWEAAKSAVSTTVEGIKTGVTGTWESIQAALTPVVEGITGNITSAWDTAQTTVGTALEGISGKVTTVWDAVKTNITNAVTNVKTSITTGFNAAKTTVSTIFEGIRSKISTVMTSAKTAVTDAISRIKSAFKFTWSLPHLKLPHISISGSFSLKPPRVPHFSISWYKKAMDDGMILNTPTIFGQKGNTLLAGGEAGSEAVVGTQSLMEMIRNAVASMAGQTTINYGGVNINVYQKENQDIRALADEIEYRINNNVMRRRAAVGP